MATEETTTEERLQQKLDVDFEELEESIDDDTLEACVILHEDGQHETVPLQTLADPDAPSMSSLGRLEQDLTRLQAKWDDVEEMLQDRDLHIQELEAEADEDRNAIIALEAEIQALTTDKGKLGEELTDLEQRFNEQRSIAKEADFTVNHLEEELNKARTRYDELYAEHRELERELDRETRAAADAAAAAEDVSTKSSEYKAAVQELESYIDGRKDKWNEQRDELARQTRTIADLEAKLEEQQQALADANNKNAALAEQILGLEKKISEFEGRQAERESSNAELRRAMEEQSQELGSLRKQAEGHDRELEQLTKQLSAKDDQVGALQAELKEGKAERIALEKTLASEQKSGLEAVSELEVARQDATRLESLDQEKSDEIAELRTSLGELKERLRQAEPHSEQQEQRIVDLQQTIESNTDREKSLRDELSAALAKLQEQSDATETQRDHAKELSEELAERDAEISRLNKAVEMHLDQIRKLKEELESQRNHFDLLEKNADRISAIQSGVRQLDSQIAVSKPTTEIEKNRHTIIVTDPTTDRELRYLLQKDETTIGRSRTCDIRVDSKYVSRRHARIVFDDGGLTLEDIGSTNGFQVNDEVVTKHKLSHGDEFDIGLRRFAYVDGNVD